MNKDKANTKLYVEWIDLKVPEPSEPYYEKKDYSVHCSLLYQKAMDHLPCGWIRDWEGRQAKELIDPIKLSLAKLKSHPMSYEKYQVDLDGYLKPYVRCRVVDDCPEILQTCLENFEEAPDLLIEID